MNIPLLVGLGMVLLGGIITGATYSAADPGGTYLVTTGLFLVGGLNTVRGLGLQMRINRLRREYARAYGQHIS
jgi:uncharacterized membrane protein YedE/YeeE